MWYTLSFVKFGITIVLGLHLLACTVNVSANSVNTISAINLKNSSNINDVRNLNYSEMLSAANESVRTGTTFILTPIELQLFRNSLNVVRDTKCRSDLNATLNGILTGQNWAISMYDSTAKTALGVESGILYQFGHYDECLKQIKSLEANQSVDIPVHTKYCLTDVTLDGITVLNIDTRKEKLSDKVVTHWGACVPASCGKTDLENYLSNFLQRTVTVDEKKCEVSQKSIVVTNGMLAYIVVILIFVSLALLSTGYHIFLLGSSKWNEDLTKSTMKHETLTIALLSFSVIENTKKLFQASTEQLGLNSINGIKASAMILILIGHALSFIFGSPTYNSGFINEQLRKPAFAFLSNSLLFVDVFLLLSGFLFCRIFLIELERRRGKINVLVLYAGRYIRLTPAYLATMGFYMTWFVHIGDGPIWKERITREQERCMASWWLNALYINNYINTDKLCMFQSWYLSVDSQMFFLAPIAIYLLYYSCKIGVRFLYVFVVITAIIPFIVTYLKKLEPTLLVYADEMTDLATNAYYIGYYIKTHLRASAYVLGLLLGYLVHVTQENSTKLPKYFVRMAWIFAIVIGVSSMFTISRFYNAPFTNLESTLYSGFHKIGWNLSIAWLVFASTTGHAGCLQHILSSRFFAPISRLAYCAYLSNGIVELYHSSVLRSPTYMSYVNLTNSAFSHIIDTFILAFIICLLFESPIHALERILLRKYGGKERKATQNHNTNSHTPSTSEEQIT